MAKLKALKPRAVYRCQGCGHVELKWLGRCPTCQAWSTLVEEFERDEPPRPSARGVSDGSAPAPITEVGAISAADRRATGIGELDRVLGGGLVAGCLALLGGDPGVGKSTLLIQALAGLARGSGKGAGVLYATGEESVAQTAMRARRVGAADARLAVVAETDVEKILEHAAARRPGILAVDSIQTMYTPALESIPGSLAQ
ncbi:MAG TPA: AAA family ATPase, partial [Kofleriaceae bacterium]|nr:AAA family ATPase [Kofleriaceae bacterium]